MAPKTAGKKRARDAEAELSGGEADVKPAPVKKAKSKKAAKADGIQTDSEGNPYWEIADKRRVGISQFKKVEFINIREYYEAGGEMKPGKKGIGLTVEQYNALLKAIPAINAELRRRGHDIEDSDSGGAPVTVAAEEPPTNRVAKKQEKQGKRANIEATSDEDSGSD